MAEGLLLPLFPFSLLRRRKEQGTSALARSNRRSQARKSDFFFSPPSISPPPPTPLFFFDCLHVFKQTPPPPPPPPAAAAPPPPPSRRSSILGDIVETTGTTPFPEPEADDFFQGESWEWLGSAAAVAVPALVLAAVAVGAFAAKTYDSGADSVLLPASGEDRPAVVVPVEEFDRKVAEMSR